MIAIICETPYQLLCGLNLAYSLDDDKYDILVLSDMFKSHRKFELLATATSSPYIRNVIYVHHEKSLIARLTIRISRNYNIILPRFIDKLLLKRRITTIFDTEKYNKIICQRWTGHLLALTHRVLGNDAKIYITEDGVGDYYSYSNSINNGDKYSDLKAYLVGRFLQAPDLYMGEPIYTNYPAPHLSKDKAFLEIIDSVFGKPKSIPSERFIFLDQPFSNDFKNNHAETREKEIIADIVNIVSRDDFIYKPHPRMDFNNVDYKLLESVLPWEVYLIYLSSIKNRVLISAYSTAIISPKILLDEEPYVICLFKLLEDDLKSVMHAEEYESILRLMTNVKNIYRNPEKFIIPSSQGELIRELNMIMNK